MLNQITTKLENRAAIEDLRHSLKETQKEDGKRLISLCAGSGCGAYGTAKVHEALQEELDIPLGLIVGAVGVLQKPFSAAKLSERREPPYVVDARGHELFGRHLMGYPVEQQKYQALANLMLSFPEGGEAGDYRHQLDLDGHARPHRRVGRVDADGHGVQHDAGHGLGQWRHLRDLATEQQVGQRIHGDRRRLCRHRHSRCCRCRRRR